MLQTISAFFKKKLYCLQNNVLHYGCYQYKLPDKKFSAHLIYLSFLAIINTCFKAGF